MEERKARGLNTGSSLGLASILPGVQTPAFREHQLSHVSSRNMIFHFIKGEKKSLLALKLLKSRTSSP